MAKNQEIISGILDAISNNNVDGLLRLLAESTAEQRNELCGVDLPGYPGITALMALVAMIKAIGLEPLRAFLKGLNAEQRLVAIQHVFPKTSNFETTAFTRILERYENQSILTILAKDIDRGKTIAVVCSSSISHFDRHKNRNYTDLVLSSSMPKDQLLCQNLDQEAFSLFARNIIPPCPVREA